MQFCTPPTRYIDRIVSEELGGYLRATVAIGRGRWLHTLPRKSLTQRDSPPASQLPRQGSPAAAVPGAGRRGTERGSRTKEPGPPRVARRTTWPPAPAVGPRRARSRACHPRAPGNDLNKLPTLSLPTTAPVDRAPRTERPVLAHTVGALRSHRRYLSADMGTKVMSGPPDGYCSVLLGAQDCHRRIKGAGSVIEALTVSCSLHRDALT
jgi:hypothetical protein